MAKTAYLSGQSPRIFAHRGLHLHKSGIDENSLEAFLEAIEHGATHVESDVHATSDGIAVLFHDESLERVAGIPRLISQTSFAELSQITLQNGTKVPSLEEAFSRLPGLKLNLDIKSASAILPTVSAIEAAGAHQRVLVSSFSNRRRNSALRALSQPVATSAASSQVLLAWISHNFLGGLGFGRLTRDLDAFQIPISSAFLRFDTQSFIARASKHDVEVHFWTINDPYEMRRLLSLGASGIVTDRVDLFGSDS